MVLTDTHTHQYYETDSVKKDEVIQRCISNGVSRLFLPNVDSSSIAQVMDMVNRYPQNCFAMMGLHPCDVKANWEEELEVIYAALQQNKVYAVGEIGIDLYWDKTFISEQQEAFRQQIGWAKAAGLPINIHCRNAFDEVYEVLTEQHDDKLRGIFHCFSGTLEHANKIIDLDFKLGIGGVVTYKNAGLDKVVEQIDLKHVVLETDSPYLTPVPFRGKPNESSYLVHVAQKVADLHRTSIEAVAEITTENSKTIFGV
ncbi:TatD family hydrolase [Mucilaginibacter aquatilis]|uniref:YchF/TatD family DNA exonuclease n=1 Tax=Mucilaginibacter aquatilis TaxID=1517760 RepID=A0A6I4IBE2_9SPHI|nr:TatD family hydrolase [Mucilaginibacter aquatilis]MVN90846.1 YchF/TatD family DNA exonuclease [Mucilaginibacter aquatilis]